MKMYVIDSGGKRYISDQELINNWESLSYKDKERYWADYQEALKNQFEENKNKNLASGDLSYFDQLIRSTQNYQNQIGDSQYYNTNSNINQSENMMGLVLIISIVGILISLIKK